VIGQKFKAQTELLELDEEGRIILDLEKILQTRTKRLRTIDIKEYLIKWNNLSIEDASWEDEGFLQQHPGLFNVENN
ncbi:hypothetical protein KI387_016480, partial [Taxus chinensis]